MGAENINDKEFEATVIKGKKLSIVFFWADWDGASKTCGPTFEQAANDYANLLAFYKMDMGANSVAAMSVGIRAVPTFATFKNGQMNGLILGAVTRARLNDLIAKA